MATSARVAYIENTAVAPNFAACTAWAAGYPNGRQQPQQVAALIGGRVYLYAYKADTLVVQEELIGFTQKITTLTLADYDGDGRDDLWVALAGSGAIYVYNLSDQYQLMTTGGRAWSDVAQILTPDLDGDGFADAVARTVTGNVAVFMRRPSGLQTITIPSSMLSRLSKAAFIAAGDIDKDGGDELVLARDKSYVTVWQWATTGVVESVSHFNLGAKALGENGPALAQEHLLRPQPAADDGSLQSTWEWYPADSLGHVSVTNIGNDNAAEVLISTKPTGGKGVIYIFATDSSGSLVQKGAHAIADMAGLRLVTSVGADQPAQLLTNFSDKVGLWQARATSTGWAFDQVWASEFSLNITQMLVPDSALLLVAKNGLHTLKRVSADYLRIWHAGVDVSEQAAPIFSNNTLYLPVSKMWKELLDLKLDWYAPAKRLTILRGLRLLIVADGASMAVLDDVTVQLPNAPIIKDGVFYLSVEAIRLLAPEVVWQPEIRELSIP